MSGSYSFSTTRGVVISERKTTGEIKKRPIQVSEVRDRLVQRAIVRKIEPILRKKFKLNNNASFAYLEGTGIRDALRRMLQLYKEGYNICLEADIEKFFDTIDKKALLEKVFTVLHPDESLNYLIEDAISQRVGNINDFSQEEQILFPGSGIAQGGALSPVFANVYLSDFDESMMKKSFQLIRYADDFVVMCKSREEAQEAYECSKKILEEDLKLKMHNMEDGKESKTKIIVIGPKSLDFLGSTFTAARLHPTKKAVNKLKKKIEEITDFNKSRKLIDVLKKLSNLLDGWVSSYCYADIAGVIQAIYKIVCERLGVYGHKIEWLPRRGEITDKQFANSGLPNMIGILRERRKVLLWEKENHIFTEFWSK